VNAEDAVRLAIQAAGRLDDEWETRVQLAVQSVAAAMRPQSDAMRVAGQLLDPDTKIIFGVYRGKQLEESSQRMIVSFMADNGDEEETMRTHRIDEPAGHAMNIRLIGIKPGERCAFFKYVDKLGPKSSSRILVGIERQPIKNARVSAPPQRHRGTGAERLPADPPSAVEAPAPNQSRATVLRGLLGQLPEEKRLASIELLKSMGWEAADDIPEEDFEKALYIVRHQRKDWY
jgi:hypothetical protein